MLVQFSVENYRSFHSEEILSMIPAKSRIHPKHVLRSEEKGRRVRALPLAVLYGANASGKSNLIRAMRCARKLVVDGTRSESQIPVQPFQLASEARGKGSRFEFVLKHDDVLYTYGFVVTAQEVKEEWLFGVFAKNEVRLFERVTEDGRARVEVGARLASTKGERQRLQFVAAGTRPNQLFLTEAHERNVEPLEPLLHWFREHLTIISPEARYQPLVLRAHSDKEFAEFVADVLSTADTGIKGLSIEDTKLDDRRVWENLPDDAKKEFLEALRQSPSRSVGVAVGKALYAFRQQADEEVQVLTLQTRHSADDGKHVFFDIRAESDGTHRLMHLAPALLNLRKSDDVYVIDELDRSLHPHLCRMYLDAFLFNITDRGCRGQMIVTTHETSLLDLDLLRRDEIWFVEKDTQGASHLTSLAEFRVKADLRISKGYLSGRFGAIPFVGDVRRLFPAGGCK
jgi:hypothetical protein